MQVSCRGFLRIAGALLVAQCLLPVLLLLGCGGTPTAVSSIPQLTQLKVAPQGSQIALGHTVQFTVTGTLSNGSSKDETKTAVWTSSNPGVASVDPSGIVTSHSTGIAILTASAEAMTASSTLTVSNATIVSIDIGPTAPAIALGTTVQLKATGAFTDGSTQDVTKSVTWTSSDPKIATVTADGVATAESIGAVSIAAGSQFAKASSQLTILPPTLVSIAVGRDRSTIPLGSTAHFTAQGVYTDGSTSDLSNSISWNSSPAGIVTIDHSGFATAHTIGTATVAAQAGSIAGTSTLTVSAAQLTSIAISAAQPTMSLGTSQHLAAQGTYSDGSTGDLTTSVSWSSDSDKIISVSIGGEAVANTVGSAMISATAAGLSGRVPLTVSPAALTSISISPATQTIPLAGSLQLTPIGSFTDGSTQDITSNVTWTVDDTAIIQVTSTGNAIAQQVGSTKVEGSFNGISGSATIIVEPIALTSYFSGAGSSVDGAVRIATLDGGDNNSCAMVYVFDQDQQMAECCGCHVSQDGLRTLSLNKDLTANPLTGVRPVTGSLMVVTADYKSNPSCSASSIAPGGTGAAWATHLQQPTPTTFSVSETPFVSTPLGETLSTALQAQCQFIQQLGSGQGICRCGTGD